MRILDPITKKIRNLSPDALDAFEFAIKNKGNWHTVASDNRTAKAVRILAGMGLVQVNSFGQYRATTTFGTPGGGDGTELTSPLVKLTKGIN